MGSAGCKRQTFPLLTLPLPASAKYLMRERLGFTTPTRIYVDAS